MARFLCKDVINGRVKRHGGLVLQALQDSASQTLLSPSSLSADSSVAREERRAAFAKSMFCRNCKTAVKSSTFMLFALSLRRFLFFFMFLNSEVNVLRSTRWTAWASRKAAMVSAKLGDVVQASEALPVAALLTISLMLRAAAVVVVELADEDMAKVARECGNMDSADDGVMTA